jgi:hypothetical protein
MANPAKTEPANLASDDAKKLLLVISLLMRNAAEAKSTEEAKNGVTQAQRRSAIPFLQNRFPVAKTRSGRCKPAVPPAIVSRESSSRDRFIMYFR